MQKVKLKGSRGITLIALIITIVIMLILAGVTINISLEGGLFGTANDAMRQTEEAIIYDEIFGSMKVNNGKYNVRATYDSAEERLEAQGRTVELAAENATTINFKVTGKKGTYEYSITETEIKIGYTQIPEETMLDKLQVLVGEGALGLLGEFNTTTLSFKFNTENEKCKNFASINIYTFAESNLALLRDSADNNKEYYIKMTSGENLIITEIGIYPTPIIENYEDLIILTNYKNYIELGATEERASFLVPGELKNEDEPHHEPGRLPASANTIMINNGTWEVPELRGLENVLVPINFEGTLTGVRNIDTSTLYMLEGVPTVTIEDVTYYKVPWTDN